jgi:hypothetical protein
MHIINDNDSLGNALLLIGFTWLFLTYSYVFLLLFYYISVLWRSYILHIHLLENCNITPKCKELRQKYFCKRKLENCVHLLRCELEDRKDACSYFCRIVCCQFSEQEVIMLWRSLKLWFSVMHYFLALIRIKGLQIFLNYFNKTFFLLHNLPVLYIHKS